MEKKSSKFIKEVWEWSRSILLAIFIALLIRGFIFEPVEVDGISMENTLGSGERLIVYKLGYYFSPPERGDIVVLQVKGGAARLFPFLQKTRFIKKAIPDIEEIDYIKRVIAVPGDEIDIRDGKVYINGDELDEPYIKGNTYALGQKFPFTVEEDTYFVMGDNRQSSHDSRQIGLIDIDKIKGKAVLRIWPVKAFGKIEKHVNKVDQ